MKPSDFSFFSRNPVDGAPWGFIIIAMLIGFGVFFGLMNSPSQVRRPVTWFVTFLSGGIFVLAAYWPKPVNFDAKAEKPANFVEAVGSFLSDSTGVVGSFTQILAAFMLGLGIISLLRIHTSRIARQKQDWGFSVVLLTSMFSMAIFGYWDWLIRIGNTKKDFDIQSNWLFANRMRDFMFEGLLQQMDAAMFSIIAFFILSAAYRAFRARSVEATILLGTALLVMLSLMGAVASFWDGRVEAIAGTGSSKDFILNFKVTEIAQWIKNTFQTPAITGIKFGIGLGTLSMALRIWLGLEKGGK